MFFNFLSSFNGSAVDLRKLGISLFNIYFPASILLPTLPSHISLRLLPVIALVNLDWKSLPSKNSHGQHSSHGMGAPQASLANRAASTPRMKMEANWTPLGVIWWTCRI